MNYRIKPQRQPVGSNIRKTWDDIRKSSRPPVWYLDLESSDHYGITKNLSLLAMALDLNMYWVAPHPPENHPGAARTLILKQYDPKGSLWTSLEQGKVAVRGAPSSGNTENPYLEALNGLHPYAGSIILAPATIGQRLRPGVAIDIDALFLLSRPLLLARDSTATLPPANKDMIKRSTKPSRMSGWSEWARLQAAKLALKPFDIYWRIIVHSSSRCETHLEPWVGRFQALWVRFEQLLHCRDEIEWAQCMMHGDSHFMRYRFDHMILLATAFLDQLAAILLDAFQLKSPRLQISMAPQRGKSGKGNEFPKQVQAAVNLTNNTRTLLMSPGFAHFRSFIYEYRNFPAHRSPTETTSYDGYPDRPRASLVPIHDAFLSEYGKNLRSRPDYLAQDSFSNNANPLILDPLVFSWLIVSELHLVAGAIIDCVGKRIVSESELERSAIEVASDPGIDEIIEAAIPVFLP